MIFSDQWLICVECGRQFLWDAGEQAWYHVNKLEHPPKHCKVCRDRRRDKQHTEPRKYSRVNCERCGSLTFVPFVPHGIKPVYCRPCLMQA